MKGKEVLLRRNRYDCKNYSTLKVRPGLVRGMIVLTINGSI